MTTSRPRGPQQPRRPHGGRPRRGAVVVPLTDMRIKAFLTLVRFSGSAGAGAFLGLAAAGLIAVGTGRVFASGSPWLAGLPTLAVFGALLTPALAWLTRRWLLPRFVRRRKRWAAVSGLVLMPLAAAAGQLDIDLAQAGLVLVLIGGVTTMALWLRWYLEQLRRSRRPTRA